MGTTSVGLDGYMVYQFIKRLSQPFDQTDAFKNGIIDSKGNKLKDPSTSAEKQAYTLYDRLIFNLKKILSKVGFGSQGMSMAAAIALVLKEDPQWREHMLNDFNQDDYIMIKKLLEDAPVNNAGGGAVAGLVGDPPVRIKRRRRRTKTNDVRSS